MRPWARLRTMSSLEDARMDLTLAAAHAENGQFEEAVKEAEVALKLAQESDREEVKRSLKLFRNKRLIEENRRRSSDLGRKKNSSIMAARA